MFRCMENSVIPILKIPLKGQILPISCLLKVKIEKNISIPT